jgi:hypothetical protein
MTRSLTAEALHTLDHDQIAAIRSYVTQNLGAEALRSREARYTPGEEDTPSLLEARITDEVEHADGTIEPAAWLCAFGAGYPPAWKRWETVDPIDVEEHVTAEVIEPAAPKKRRRTRT